MTTRNKHVRLGTILANVENNARYDDVHVVFGGTGAVGGTAILKMIELYEGMMGAHPPVGAQVPVLIPTGTKQQEVKQFKDHLQLYLRSRHGVEAVPTEHHDELLTHTGIRVAPKLFEVTVLQDISDVASQPRLEREEALRRYLARIDVGTDVIDALAQQVMGMRDFSSFLKAYRDEHIGRADFRYRSVIVAIPLPSVVAYRMKHLALAKESLADLNGAAIKRIKRFFRRAVAADLKLVRDELAECVVVAHTTAVGGMYDEWTGEDGRTRRQHRLGFSHSAQDSKLREKRRNALKFTRHYSNEGIKTLITAAAVGIDDVKIRGTVQLHDETKKKLKAADIAGKKLFSDSAAGEFQTVHVFRPLTIPLETPSSTPLTFSSPKEDADLRPMYQLRSGENGYLSVANAEALYRVMRVASMSELGLLLARIGLFHDDPEISWFDRDGICYFTETDNSRQVLEFLAQPAVRQVQTSGLEPMALVDLGSSKHQGELHTLGLLILLHRIKTLDMEAISQHEGDQFDARTFVQANSRPLTFEDLETWRLESVEADLSMLAAAETPEDLVALVPFQLRGGGKPSPWEDSAYHRVLDCILKAVWTVPCLGSPLVYRRDGVDYLRTGYFVAPLAKVIDRESYFSDWFKKKHTKYVNRMKKTKPSDVPCGLEDFRDHHICVDGFVDLRPHAIVSTAWDERADLREGSVARVETEDELRRELGRLRAPQFFSTCGLLAVLFRLRCLYSYLNEAKLELGTLGDARWQMPRLENGNILVFPGVVEAMRMVSEGLEKATGTELLDGRWGYLQQVFEDRRPGIAATA